MIKKIIQVYDQSLKAIDLVFLFTIIYFLQNYNKF